MMRFALTAALLLALAAPAAAERCDVRQASLGSAGRAGIVAFTTAVHGTPVCALYANLALDGVSARAGDAPGALIAAAVTPGTGAMLTIGGDAPGLAIAAAGTPAPTGAFAVGPFAIAPGGVFPPSGGDSAEVPRVVIGYAGARLVVLRTSPIALIDLTRILREQPDLFGADAFERAAIVASGSAATMQVRTPSGTLGDAVTTPSAFSIINRL